MASDSFRIPARKYHSMTFLTSQIEDRTDEASQGDLFIERIGIRMEFTQIDIHLIQGCFDRSANRIKPHSITHYHTLDIPLVMSIISFFSPFLIHDGQVNICQFHVIIASQKRNLIT